MARPDDIDRELQTDLELEADEQRDRGLTDQEAIVAARRALGNRTRIKEEIHDMSPWAPVETLRQDFQYALRMFRRSKAFTAISILTLALGIGACTAIFSIVYAVLLRPLPYPEPERLVLVWTELRTRHVMDFPFPIPDVKDLRAETKTLETVAGLFPPGRVSVNGESGPPEQARVVAGTTNLLSVLGARIEYGRDFVEEDGTPQRLPAAAAQGATAAPAPPLIPVSAVLTHEFWVRRFGGDPSVVGRVIPFGGGRAQIVGIIAPGFQLLFPPRTGIDPAVDIYTALRLNFETAARNTGALRVVARLKSGVTIEEAQADADGLASGMRDRYAVKKNAGVHWRVVPMHADLVSDVRASILSLFGAVVFVLLIACANVANLLGVRAAARHRELVIRAAIGGTRSRLIRQLLTETLLLAAVGAACGLGIAAFGIRVLLAMAPAKLPLMTSIGINPAVLAFTAAAAVATAAICGVVPALRASRPQIVDALRVTQGAVALRAGRTVRNLIVVAEVSLSFVLLVGSGLMVRSFVALQRTDPGFDPQHVLTFLLQARQPDQARLSAFLNQAADRLRAIPGVESVSAASPMPLDGGTSNVPWATAEAGAADPSAFRQADFATVRPDYFETMKTPLMAGRTFTEADNTGDAAKVVVDEQLAGIAYPGQSPIGRQLLVRNLRSNGPNAPQNDTVEIIGVVRHQRHQSLTENEREQIFFVDQYFGGGAAGRWAVRTAAAPESVGPSIREAMAELDPKMPIAEMQPMTAFVEKAVAPTRFSVVLISIFAGIAVILAVVGLYGVLSTVVRQRTAEIGVRVAFGASQPAILRLIVGEGLRLSGVGIIVGIAAALAVTGVMQSMLVSVKPTDPITFASITLLFLVISALAAWLPARRAARLAPTIALRNE